MHYAVLFLRSSLGKTRLIYMNEGLKGYLPDMCQNILQITLKYILFNELPFYFF